MARRCMASALRPRNWYGRWGRWPKGSGFGRWRGSLRSTPNTALNWVVEAGEHPEDFSPVPPRVQIEQVQLDELFALLSAVKDGEVTEDEAIPRLSRSPHWVWVALDPVTKLLLAVDVGERTLAMAQRLVHQVTQVLAPDCTPLFLTDGFREYLTALVTHYGQWTQPERRQAQGPMPRWMPGEYAVQTRSRVAPAVGTVPCLS